MIPHVSQASHFIQTELNYASINKFQSETAIDAAINKQFNKCFSYPQAHNPLIRA